MKSVIDSRARCKIVAGVVGTILLAASTSASAQHKARPGRWVLVYGGAPAQHKAFPRYTTDDLTRLVAVVDTSGRPAAWLTNGAIFVELYAPSTHSFTDWIGGTPANGGDWRAWADTILAPSGPMARLDSVVGLVGNEVGQEEAPYQISVMIPYPDTKVDTLQYDGRTYHLNVVAEGAALADAYMGDIIETFKARHFAHLALHGFYWLHETIVGRDTAIVPAVAQKVHARGLRFIWVPWFDASGAGRWRRLGFDEAWMQPNYFFNPAVPKIRLDSAVLLSRRVGMGTEIEFDSRLLTSPEHADRLTPYLTHLDSAPDMREQTVVIYEGHGGLIDLSKTRDPEKRALYDRLVQALGAKGLAP